MTSRQSGDGRPAGQRWEDPERLLDDLAEALADPGQVPPEYLDAGRAALAWRTIDTDLARAQLDYDSLRDPELAARARSHTGARSLVFRGPGVGLDLQVGPEGLVGQLNPAALGGVEVCAAGGVLAEADPDDIGCFTVTPAPSGPVRLRWRTAAGVVVTDWVRL